MKISILSAFLIILSTICYGQQSTADSVTITFQVEVPESTPDGATIFWAGSLNRWEPGNGLVPFMKPKALAQKGTARQIELTSATGDTVSYKYTRGSIFSVEEQADFTYRPVRAVVFDESKTVRDTVTAWHDRPPASLQEQWPEVKLEQTKKAVSYNGQPMNGDGTLVTDMETGARFTDMSKLNTETAGIPENIGEHVFYFLKVSDAPDNTVLIFAGKPKADSLWNVYVDQDNNSRIDPGEMIFTARPDSGRKSWTGNVYIKTMSGNSVVSDSVNLSIHQATDLPDGYTSSINPKAPDLFYELPFKQRKGKINGNTFYLTASFPTKFSKFFRLSVDRDRNDTLEIGSGSNEISTIELNQMFRQQKFYMHPAFRLRDNFWEVVTITPDGSSIRLRPARNAKAKANITKGKAAPNWKATTVGGDPISSQSVQGKYVLLDFWGSWCGPCIQEIPKLKKLYQRFKSNRFEMIGFAYENKASLEKALTKYDLPWPQVLDDEGTYSSKFLVQGYPTKYLIGPEGTVLETGNALRGEKLVETLEKYLE